MNRTHRTLPGEAIDTLVYIVFCVLSFGFIWLMRILITHGINMSYLVKEQGGTE